MKAISRSSRFHSSSISSSSSSSASPSLSSSSFPSEKKILNPYDSFAPERNNIKANWYVDGKTTFAAMETAILSAKAEIFITDWFLSPELFLRREDECGWPDLKGRWKKTQSYTFLLFYKPLLKPLLPVKKDEHRLDKLLKTKADRGVKIYVLLWNETKIAVELNSLYSKTQLEKLSSNIMVMRHPVAFPVKWSHHQKTLVIDQDLAVGIPLSSSSFFFLSHTHTSLSSSLEG
jgi:phospholipase D1/2